MKQCNKCKELKQDECFFVRKCKSGRMSLRSRCKMCYYKTSPENKKLANQKWEEKNPEYKKNWYILNKSKRYKKMKMWRYSNKNKLNEYFKNKRATDINYRIASNLRSRLNIALRRQKTNPKTASAIKDLGCSIQYLKTYLESKFQEGMTWDNYGPKGWHIDHINPLSKFDLSNSDQFLEACHYTNLQPLWWQNNLSKSNKGNV